MSDKELWYYCNVPETKLKYTICTQRVSPSFMTQMFGRKLASLVSRGRRGHSGVNGRGSHLNQNSSRSGAHTQCTACRCAFSGASFAPGATRPPHQNARSRRAHVSACECACVFEKRKRKVHLWRRVSECRCTHTRNATTTNAENSHALTTQSEAHLSRARVQNVHGRRLRAHLEHDTVCARTAASDAPAAECDADGGRTRVGLKRAHAQCRALRVRQVQVDDGRQR